MPGARFAVWTRPICVPPTLVAGGSARCGMSDVRIEALRAAHLPVVIAIEKASFSVPWTLGMFVQELEDNQLSRSFVALEGSLVAG